MSNNSIAIKNFSSVFLTELYCVLGTIIFRKQICNSICYSIVLIPTLKNQEGYEKLNEILISQKERIFVDFIRL